jgi:hypothetical protein
VILALLIIGITSKNCKKNETVNLIKNRFEDFKSNITSTACQKVLAGPNWTISKKKKKFSETTETFESKVSKYVLWMENMAFDRVIA